MNALRVAVAVALLSAGCSRPPPRYAESGQADRLAAAGWTRYVKLHNLSRWDVFGPANYRTPGSPIDREHLRQRAELIPGGATVFLSIETFPEWDPWHADTATSLGAVARWADLLDFMREIRPDLKLGIWSYPPLTGGRGLVIRRDDPARLATINERMTPLVQRVDVLFAACYLNNFDADEMLDFMQAADVELATYGKRVIWYASVVRNRGGDWSGLCDLPGFTRQLTFLARIGAAVAVWIEPRTDLDAAKEHLQAVEDLR